MTAQVARTASRVLSVVGVVNVNLDGRMIIGMTHAPHATEREVRRTDMVEAGWLGFFWLFGFICGIFVLPVAIWVADKGRRTR